MSSYVLGFEDIDKTKIMVVGGKGANLGEISKVEGIRVPDGFCISTEAFKRIIGETPSTNELLDQLSILKVEDRNKISELSGEIRRLIEGIAIPEDIHEELVRHLSRLGEENAYAVRSSATAEDLPAASFAGQQDTYLNIIGKEVILEHVSKCWASLYTERAVTYRIQNGFDHRKVHLAVVVQKMIFPQAAGILFTADPVTSNRKVSSIDARRLALRRYPPRSWLYVPHKMAARKNRRLSLSGRIGKRSRMSRFCSSSTWAERSKNISATPRTSNGA